ncbi:MAG: hypothetical protein R3B70_23940 [Polyangiaceae bacterium]
MTSPVRTALLLAATLALTACGSPRRDDCRTLGALLNNGADRIDKARATPLDPHGLKSLADILEQTATEADALKLQSEDLQKLSKDYASLLREVARNARDMATAGEAGDADKAKAESETMEKLIAAEPKLIAEVNKLCSAE